MSEQPQEAEKPVDPAEEFKKFNNAEALPDDATEETEPKAEGAEADEAEKPVESEAGEESGNKPKPKRTLSERQKQIQERIAELTRARHERERELAELEERLNSKKKELTPPTSDATDADNPPDPKKYEFGELDDRYQEARLRYHVKKAFEAEKAAEKKAKEAEAAAAKQRELAQKLADFETAGSEKYDDFDEVVIKGAQTGAWSVSPVIGELILSSENGPDVAYHLASNPKLARQLFGKSPLEQAAAFGRLEASLASKSDAQPAQPKQVNQTKAPPPPTAIRGKDGRFQGAVESADFVTFEAAVRAQQR